MRDRYERNPRAGGTRAIRTYWPVDTAQGGLVIPRRWLAIWLCLSVVAVSVLGCGPRGVKTVRFHLPPGFKGVVSVVPTGATGATFGGGAVTDIQVPPDGVLVVDSLQGYENGYNEEFMTSPGTVLEYNNPDLKSGRIQVFSLGRPVDGDGNEKVEYFVGTAQEYDDYCSARDKSTSG